MDIGFGAPVSGAWATPRNLTELGRRAVVYEVATPRTYERFTHRPNGAVGGIRQALHNTNQHAVPHDIGVPGFWLAGDTTWPGLGTVACVLGSRLVAEGVLAAAHQSAQWSGRRRVRGYFASRTATPAHAAPTRPSNQKWLPVATTM